VPIAVPTARLPASAKDDIAYVEASFEPMSESVRPLVEQGLLPRATYVLPDGTPMVPADHAQLLDDASGDPEAIPARFRQRYVAAGGDPADADEEYEAWLSGEYGACLHTTSPESIVIKGALMDAITALVARPAPTDASWWGRCGAQSTAWTRSSGRSLRMTASGSAAPARATASSREPASASPRSGHDVTVRRPFRGV